MDDKALFGRPIGTETSKAYETQNIKTVVCLPAFSSWLHNGLVRLYIARTAKSAVTPSAATNRRLAVVNNKTPNHPSRVRMYSSKTHQRDPRTSPTTSPSRRTQASPPGADATVRTSPDRVLATPTLPVYQGAALSHILVIRTLEGSGLHASVSPADLHEHMEINGKNGGACQLACNGVQYSFAAGTCVSKAVPPIRDSLSTAIWGRFNSVIIARARPRELRKGSRRTVRYDRLRRKLYSQAGICPDHVDSTSWWIGWSARQGNLQAHMILWLVAPDCSRRSFLPFSDATARSFS